MDLPDYRRRLDRLAALQPDAGGLAVCDEHLLDFGPEAELRAVELQALGESIGQCSAAALRYAPGKGMGETGHVEDKRARAHLVRRDQ